MLKTQKKQVLRFAIFVFIAVPDFFEDGLPPPAQAYLKVCSAVSEASLNDATPSSPSSILSSPKQEAASPPSGTTVQRRSVLHTEEIVSLSHFMFSLFKVKSSNYKNVFFPHL